MVRLNDHDRHGVPAFDFGTVCGCHIVGCQPIHARHVITGLLRRGLKILEGNDERFELSEADWQILLHY